jgi:hypothetical protein
MWTSPYVLSSFVALREKQRRPALRGLVRGGHRPGHDAATAGEDGPPRTAHLRQYVDGQWQRPAVEEFVAQTRPPYKALAG